MEKQIDMVIVVGLILLLLWWAKGRGKAEREPVKKWRVE